MQIMLEYARSEGLSVVAGQVLHDNHTMLKMCEELGFEIEHIEDTGDLVSVRLPLGSKSQVIVEH
jgi:acetyltransferase